jgi:hypothetical protein
MLGQWEETSLDCPSLTNSMKLRGKIKKIGKIPRDARDQG